MGFMYGNITSHLPRTNFKITKVYPNRALMQFEAEEETTDNIEEEIYIAPGSYLLVDYSMNGSEHYSENWAADQEKYKSEDPKAPANNNFDLTVWQVQQIEVQEAGKKIEKAKCMAIARLHSILPTFEVAGSYRIDLLAPVSGGDYFGRGKNIFTLDAITGIPVTN